MIRNRYRSKTLRIAQTIKAERSLNFSRLFVIADTNYSFTVFTTGIADTFSTLYTGTIVDREGDLLLFNMRFYLL